MRFIKYSIALLALAVAVGRPAFAQNLTAPPPLSPVQNGPAQTAAAPAGSTDGYQIGPEDVIEVDVLGQSDFRSRVKVKSDGTVPLPYIGSVQRAGARLHCDHVGAIRGVAIEGVRDFFRSCRQR